MNKDSEANPHGIFNALNKSLQNLSEIEPKCYEANLYVLNNDDWIPKHIWIAPRTWYAFLGIHMTVVTISCCILNGIVIAVTLKYEALRQPFNYVILNVAVADLLAGTINGFLAIPANSSGYFFWGKALCTFGGYTMSMLSLTKMNTIALMAFERFSVICKPFGNILFGRKASMAGIALAWVWSLLWNSPPLLFWDGFEAEGFGTNCAPNWYTKKYKERMFIIFYIGLGFMVPLGFIVICCGALILNLRKIAKEICVSGSTNPEGEDEKMVILMVSAFLVTWLPYAVLALHNVLYPDFQINYGVTAISAIFAKSAIFLNSLLYIGFNQQFRDHVIRMFCNGKNPWSDDFGVGSAVSSQIATQVSSNKAPPA